MKSSGGDGGDDDDDDDGGDVIDWIGSLAFLQS